MDKEHEIQLFNWYMFILNTDLSSFKMTVLMVEIINIKNKSDKSTRIYYMSRKHKAMIKLFYTCQLCRIKQWGH